MDVLELGILDWMQANLRSPAADAVMAAVTTLGDKGAVWLLLAAVLLMHPKTQRQAAAVLAALALSALCCNAVLKPFVARTRPFELNAAVQLLVAKPHDYSFPSGHTAAAFAAAGALYFSHWPHWRWAAALAVLIGFSRLYLYVHFPSDVVAGVLLGTLLGGAGTLLANAIAHKMPLGRKELL